MLTLVALCEACGKRDDSVQLMKYGLFPVSTKQHVYLQFETLDLLSVMANFNPLLSYVTVVNALNFNSKKRRMVSPYTICESLCSLQNIHRSIASVCHPTLI